MGSNTFQKTKEKWELFDTPHFSRIERSSPCAYIPFKSLNAEYVQKHFSGDAVTQTAAFINASQTPNILNGTGFNPLNSPSLRTHLWIKSKSS